MEDNHLNDQFQEYRDPRIVEKDPLVDGETSAAFLKRLVIGPMNRNIDFW